MAEPIIATDGIDFAYGRVQALQNVDLDVPAGRVGLVGANGAGKTTLIKILLGILSPAAGSARVFGHTVADDPFVVRSKIGYMPEVASLPLDQTAADFVGYTAELGGIPPRTARQRASEVLTLVGLAEERFRYLGEFSTGMKQKAKLAQAIVHDPDLVFLDEPTAGLDPEARQEVLDLIVRLGGFGMSVVLSSHVLTDIEATCDWVVMLDGGQVLRNGPLEEISASRLIRVELLDDPAPVMAELSARGGVVTGVGSRSLEVSFDAGDPFDLIRDVLADTGVGLRSLGQKTTSLEDIFITAHDPEEDETG